MMRQLLNTYDKALKLNLDPAIYGTFAEIGAGQETANWFFRASGTAGLVAKTISAYGTEMSDAIYGKTARYVSHERLNQMLSREFAILLKREGDRRRDRTTFFAFCNTIRARAYQDKGRGGECHGWLGIRFQLKPSDPHSDICLHVRLLDETNVDQMKALGIIGVNLIYATFYHRLDLRRFVTSLTENLAPGRVEVDMLKFSGHGYDFFDNRLSALELVASGLTEATYFDANGEIQQAADALHKRPILLLRGSFNPVTRLHLEMVDQAREGFISGLPESERGQTLELCEISMSNLLRGGEVDHVDFIDRADALQALGKSVLVSRCAEFHRIAGYLSRYTTSPVAFVLSIGLLNELFKPKWSEDLQGGLLESFGRLFRNQVTLRVYPWKNRKTGEVVTADSFLAPESSRSLYQYFRENKLIFSVPYRSLDLLDYTSRDIIKMMRAGETEWQHYVPPVAWRSARRQLPAGREASAPS